MPGPLIIRIIGDATAYLRSAETTIATNTKLDTSFARVGVEAKQSADVQIAAALKAKKAIEGNIVALRAAAAAAPAGSERQVAALSLATQAEQRLSRTHIATAASTRHVSDETKVLERDLSKTTRGLLAGTGAAAGFGRSLAFASGIFLGFAGLSSAIRSAVEGAESLQKANDSLGVVIRRNNQDVGKQIPILDEWAKAQDQLGVSQTEALTGLKQTAVLTGSVQKGMLAYTMGLELARAENLSTTAAMRISAKAILGQTTSLTRYGIILPKTTNAQKIFNAFQARFANQAETNTSAFDRLHASYANLTTEIGRAALPIFEKYAQALSDWLDRMNRTGRLQRDFTSAVGAAVSVFRAIGQAVGAVDKVTGSFGNTLEILLAIKLSTLVAGWIASLEALAVEWGVVTAAATTAGEAQVGAAATGSSIAGIGKSAAVAEGAVTSLRSRILGLAGKTFVTTIVLEQVIKHRGQLAQSAAQEGRILGAGPSTGPQPGPLDFFRHPLRTFFFSPAVHDTNAPGLAVGPGGPLASLGPMFQGLTEINADMGSLKRQSAQFLAGVRRLPPLTKFDLTPLENLAAARAALTRSSADDVAAAKAVIARIKRLIDQGRLKGGALIQALQAEGNALSTVWSAEDAAAQKRAQAAQAAKQRIEARLAASIDPLKDEIALSRAQAFGGDVTAALRKLLKDALAALHKGLPPALEKQALDQIASLKQQIKQAQDSAGQTFELSPKLQLALARDTALGIDPTKDLLKAKAAILKFIRTHKKNIAALTDAYNQLAGINDQIGASAKSALGKFKELNTRKLTAGLTSLSAADRAALRARLSQIGPGGTVPGQGTGAFGVVINPQTDRPIILHNHIHLGPKEIANSTTRVQQKRRSRNPGQRRGPNAGLAGA